MKLLIFLHGTLIMHKNGIGKTREERVEQSKSREESVLDFASYVPVGNAVEKLRNWENHGVEICYLSSHENADDVEKDRQVLKKYEFPEGQIFYRQGGATYSQVAEQVMPDVLIEDDCESIGGETEMTYPHIKSELKAKIKSIMVREFEGIDNLPDNIFELGK